MSSAEEQVVPCLQVYRFLLRSNASGVVPRTQAQLNMSLACATTLIRGLDLLSPNAAPSKHLAPIARDTHRLLPYAIEYWIEHCLGYATGGSLQPDCILPHRLTELRRKHDRFLQMSERGESQNSYSPEITSESELDDRLKFMAHLPIHSLMREVLHIRWSAGQYVCENGEGKAPPYRSAQ
jgi:hypothetical protein